MRRRGKQLLELVARYFHPPDRRFELGGNVAKYVVDLVAGDRDMQLIAMREDVESSTAKSLGEARNLVVELQHEMLGQLRKGGHGAGVLEPAAVDGEQMVADPLDLAEQVRRHEHGDAEFTPGAQHQLEHLFAAGGGQAVRRPGAGEQVSAL